MKRAGRIRVFGSIIVLWSASTFSQEIPDSVQVPEFEPRCNVPDAVSFFAPLVIPKLLQDISRLKDFVRSSDFAGFRLHYGDVHAVDAIFERALNLCWNNVYEALIISFLTTMDHRRVGIRLPVIGSLVWLPLTSEFEDEFAARVNALPLKLYADTPPGRFGDRDKLQHFFGSAFLTYLFESGGAAERIGDFIEWGEPQFVVGGAYDERDLRADRQGQQFGMQLLQRTSARPSSFLRLMNATEDR